MTEKKENGSSDSNQGSESENAGIFDKNILNRGEVKSNNEHNNASSHQEGSSDEIVSDKNLEEDVEETENKKLQKLLSETKEKYTRLAAEFENYKKRNQIELSNKLKYAQQPLAKDLCGGLDNLELAIEHAKKQSDNANDEFLKGIEMVFEKFISALEQNNITRIGAVGELFDPAKHEAVGVVESGKAPADHIENIFQTGYILYDRVIRPAMVQVSKK